METPVNSVNEVQAAPTPPPEAAPPAPLTRFRAAIQGSSKRGSNAVFSVDNLKAIIETIAVFSDSATFFVNSNGVKMKVLDNARIALIEAELPRDVFTEFFADGEGSVTIDAKSLLAVLRRAKNKKVKLEYEDGTLTITIAEVRSFRVRTLDNTSEEAPEPKTAYTASALVDAELFREALIDARVMKTDAARLVALNGTLTFKAVNETKEVEVKLGTADGNASSAYSLDYLVKAVKAFGDGVIEVKFGSNAPLELANNYIKVFIAPRFE
jgi:DNA polymerase III sliding clamp (beta) subunit (PCNA family)